MMQVATYAENRITDLIHFYAQAPAATKVTQRRSSRRDYQHAVKSALSLPISTWQRLVPYLY